MSIGVPNTVVVLKKASMPASVISLNGTTNAAVSTSCAVARRATG